MLIMITLHTYSYPAQYRHGAHQQESHSSPSARSLFSRGLVCTMDLGTPGQLFLLGFGFFPLLSPKGFLLHFCICFILNANGKFRETRSEMELCI